MITTDKEDSLDRAPRAPIPSHQTLHECKATDAVERSTRGVAQLWLTAPADEAPQETPTRMSLGCERYRPRGERESPGRGGGGSAYIRQIVATGTEQRSILVGVVLGYLLLVYTTLCHPAILTFALVRYKLHQALAFIAGIHRNPPINAGTDCLRTSPLGPTSINSDEHLGRSWGRRSRVDYDRPLRRVSQGVLHPWDRARRAYAGPRRTRLETSSLERCC